MPIYDYACTACDARFDDLSRFDAPSPPCPTCASPETQRLLSTFLVPNSPAGQRRYQVDAGSALASMGCCGGGGCSTHV